MLAASSATPALAATSEPFCIERGRLSAMVARGVAGGPNASAPASGAEVLGGGGGTGRCRQVENKSISCTCKHAGVQGKVMQQLCAYDNYKTGQSQHSEPSTYKGIS